MCTSSSKPKTPKAAPAAAPIIAPITADTSAKTAKSDRQRQELAASGRSDTILTGGTGDISAPTLGKKKLLSGTE